MNGTYSWRVPTLDAYTVFEEHFCLCISGLMAWTPIDTLCSPGSTCAHCIKTGKLGSHSCALPRKRARVGPFNSIPFPSRSLELELRVYQFVMPVEVGERYGKMEAKAYQGKIASRTLEFV
ncbi:hypothetical protein CC1G_14365 [Coprinopsis cinerea okayama7|uniref:Uncharacterized protein n=1 Tax=Coprinopsis cinerea (strain Okayama-7 / 130 / ATCC MYA-4618 / FGSC 9003) TaxID=240176 RepID=D6RM74_COPC7|nr:hypothetical protein CC1G_14365 [Coprinopsis cinerea okayama7\|eukprot:XP_002911366.1 hypothetical protein CC1G_14365 [Coprinopsis cinerea okayama7\